MKLNVAILAIFLLGGTIFPVEAIAAPKASMKRAPASVVDEEAPFLEGEQGETVNRCKGQGDRCTDTGQCCEGNECMIGDRPYKTCGGG